MIAFAIGAAVEPPVPSWFWRKTATATSGRSAGAKAMKPVSFWFSRPVSAVPVFPAT